MINKVNERVKRLQSEENYRVKKLQSEENFKTDEIYNCQDTYSINSDMWAFTDDQ
jgi:hypothetical protein